MAKIIISGVNFSAPPSTPQTVTIKYRINSDPDVPASYVVVSTNTIVSVTGVITPPVEIVGLLANTTYTVAMYNNCNSNYIYKEIITNEEITYIWIEDTFVCEQDQIITEEDVYTGFSSPMGIYYNEDKARMYVVDADHTSGNIWYFNPNTFAGTGSAVHTGAVIHTIYDGSFAFDAARNRIYLAGANTNGLISYSMTTDTVVGTIAYGTNGSFSRLVVSLQGDNIYCSYSGHLVIINANTFTLTSDLLLTSIPSGTSQLADSFAMNGVLGNIWATSAAGRTVKDIAVYNSSLTSIITTIVLVGALAIPGWGLSRFFGSSFHDVEKGRFYINDLGSNKLYIINTTTYAVIKIIDFHNREGKLYSNLSMQIDPNTQKMYMSFSAFNSISDPVISNNLRLYIFDRDTLEIDYMIDNVYLAQFSYQIGTPYLWGVSRGLAFWDGGGWATDGKVTKLTY